MDELKQFLATKKGKIALAVGASLILISVLALVVLSVFGGGQGSGETTVIANPATQAGAPTTGNPNQAALATPSPTQPSSGEASSTPEPVIDMYRMYEYKDPFMPAENRRSAQSMVAQGSGSGTASTASGSASPSGTSSGSSAGGNTASNDTSGSGSTGGGSSSSSGTTSLTLQEIFERDGTRYARVVYQGTEYTVSQGEQIGDSSYQVEEIGEEDVSLLYGDDRLDLQLGEEIIK